MIKAPTPEVIAQAADILLSGGIVGMPTETVYGLAGNALSDDAVLKIFAAKNRPAINPLIIHVANEAMAAQYVEVNDTARLIFKNFWPGALTVILPQVSNCGVSQYASAGLDTLAVRMPAHNVAMDLISAAGVPLAAPSANLSGSISPTTPAHVHASLGDKVDMILAAGRCAVGVESTVLDLSGDVPVVLRCGAVSAAQIGDVLGLAVAVYEEDGAESALKSPKSPGMLLKHYAPKTLLRVNAIDLEAGEALLGFGSLKFMGVKGGGAAVDLPEELVCNLSESGDLNEAAANLFAMMHQLDEVGARGIAAMAVPNVGIGLAINDRLKRAAQR